MTVRRRFGTALLVVAVIAALITLAQFGVALTSWKFHWHTLLTGTLATAFLGALGKKLGESLSSPVAVTVKRLGRGLLPKSRLSIPGRLRVCDSRQQYTLRVHPSIPLPAGSQVGLDVQFPKYIPRRIDRDLRAWIKAHIQHGGMVVLVGDAAAGKTRSMFEALDAEVPDWWLRHVADGADVNVAASEDDDLSRTVFWLNDLERYLGESPLTNKTIHNLLNRPKQPVFLACTLRTDAFERISGRTGEPTTIEAARRSPGFDLVSNLPRWSEGSGSRQNIVRFDLDSRLDPDEEARAEAIAHNDPRVAIAVSGAKSGNVTAVLAGAEDLIDLWRHETNDCAGRAVITSAVAARHCLGPGDVPRDLVIALARQYLGLTGHPPEGDDWIPAAIDWAQQPFRGEIRAFWEAPAYPDGHELFNVSDILIQHSHDDDFHLVRTLLEEESTWTLLIDHTEPSTWVDIGSAALNWGMTDQAERSWTLAAGLGEVRALRALGWHSISRHAPAEAIEWFGKAVALGDAKAYGGLGYAHSAAGDRDQAVAFLTAGAQRGDAQAMVNLGLELRQDAEDEARAWYQRAAELGEVLGMVNLGYLLEHSRTDPDAAAAERWYRKAAALGSPGAAGNLATLLRRRGKKREALQWARIAADQAWGLTEGRGARPWWSSEASDEGISNAMLGLGRMLLARRKYAEAEKWFLRGTHIGDARAAHLLAQGSAKRDRAKADEWLERAAEFSYQNLDRHMTSLFTSYGREGVIPHLDIISDYALLLEAQGNAAAADVWRGHRAGFESELAAGPIAP